MKDSRFTKAIQGIQKAALTSSEKRAMVERIFAAQSEKLVSVNSPSYTKPVASPWNIYSFGQFIQSHRWASALVIILIIAISGNSIVLAANESLPGDTLYPFKVNVAEPIRVALASDPEVKAQIQTTFVQNRFEEAETLATRGELTPAKEQEISDLIDHHVTGISQNVEQVQKTSPEKAEDATISVQASMKAHARLLRNISSERYISTAPSSDTARIAEKATKEADKFDAQLASTAIFTKEPTLTSESYSSSSLASSTESIPAKSITKTPERVSKKRVTKAQSPAISVSGDTSATSTMVLFTNEKVSTMSSASTTLEAKKRNKEIEIYTKAKEKLYKEQNKQEIRKSSQKVVDTNKKGDHESDQSGKSSRYRDSSGNRD